MSFLIQSEHYPTESDYKDVIEACTEAAYSVVGVYKLTNIVGLNSAVYKNVIECSGQ